MSYSWFPASDRLKSLIIILPVSVSLTVTEMVSWGSQRVTSCLQVNET